VKSGSSRTPRQSIGLSHRGSGPAVGRAPRGRCGAHGVPSSDGPKKGLRILGDQEDAARALMSALDEGQRRKAIIQGAALNEIVTENKAEINPLSPGGLSAAEMTPAQRDLLTKLIDVYTSKMATHLAAERMAKLKGAGIEKVAFAWAGDIGPGKKHYYRVQGPTFLIELDNTQNDGNHIHSVWRDFNGDFGRDLLREHLKAAHSGGSSHQALLFCTSPNGRLFERRVMCGSESGSPC
jgi:hypothetical protein